MVKVLIVDDEPKARNILFHYINTFIPEVSEIRMAGSVAEAELVLGHYEPHLVFLDIEMPYQSGFDLLNLIRKPAFDIVFTTAYNRYAIQALRFNALDYLLKPISPEDLIGAFRRYRAKATQLAQRDLLFENFVSNTDKKDVRDFRLAVPSNDGVFFFTIEEIMRLEADRNYTVIHLKDKRPFVASKTLKHFEEILEQFKFIRTHKSHLVNPDYIVRISHNNEHIILSDGTTVKVSRRKKEEVKQHLKIR